MIGKARDASYITQRNQNRMLYANYIIQRERVEKGCQIRVNLQGDNVPPSSLLTDLVDGMFETSAIERDTVVSTNTCPVVPRISGTTDQIVASLTTSLASYQAASAGTWVAITSIEYTTLQSNVANTSLVGTTSSTFSLTTATAFTLTDVALTNTSTAVTPSIPANSYIYAFSIRIATTPTVTMNNVSVYANTNTGVYSGYLKLGSTLPVLVGGVNYFVLKGVSSTNGASAGLLGVTAPGGAAINSSQSYNLCWGFNITGAGMRYLNGVTLPLSSSAVLSTSPGPDRAVAIQALTTSAIQWTV